MSMGLIEGTSVEVVRYAPAGDPLELRVMGYACPCASATRRTSWSSPNRPHEPRQQPGELPVVVTIGNPNTGKSTLFNALTGMRQKVGNYPGVTVEQVSGRAELGSMAVRLVDVPGTYSLAASSPDEIIAVDVLAGEMAGLPRPAAVIVVADATNLRRNLFLVTQVLEAGLPTVLALNMTDRLAPSGINVDHEELARRPGIPVVPIAAAENRGLDALKATLAGTLGQARRVTFSVNAALTAPSKPCTPSSKRTAGMTAGSNCVAP